MAKQRGDGISAFLYSTRLKQYNSVDDQTIAQPSRLGEESNRRKEDGIKGEVEGRHTGARRYRAYLSYLQLLGFRHYATGTNIRCRISLRRNAAVLRVFTRGHQLSRDHQFFHKFR